MQAPLVIANDALSLIGAKSITDIEGTDPSSVICKQYYDPSWSEVLEAYPWKECLKRTEPYKQIRVDVSNSASTDSVTVNNTETVNGVGWTTAATLATVIEALDNVSATSSGDVVTITNSLTYDLTVTKSEEAGLIWLSTDYFFYDYEYVFPADFVMMETIFDDGGTDITEKCDIRGNSVFSDEDTIYIEYISSDGILLATYSTGTTYVKVYVQHLVSILMASKIAFRVTQNESLMQSLYQEYKIELKEAQMKNMPTKGAGGEAYWGD